VNGSSSGEGRKRLTFSEERKQGLRTMRESSFDADTRGLRKTSSHLLGGDLLIERKELVPGCFKREGGGLRESRGSFKKSADRR